MDARVGWSWGLSKQLRKFSLLLARLADVWRSRGMIRYSMRMSCIFLYTRSRHLQMQDTFTEIYERLAKHLLHS